MDTAPFLAALASAVLHAGWNAFARSRPDPGAVVAAAAIAAGVWAAPVALWLGPPPAAVWPWLLGGMAANVAAIRLAMAAYRSGPFAISYPVMRAGVPLAALPMGWLTLGEWPGSQAAGGVLAIASALGLLALAAWREGAVALRALALALCGAVASATYVVLDAVGLRGSGDVLGYACTVAVGNALAIALLTALEGRSPRTLMREQGRLAFAVSAVSMTSFLLYVYAVAVAPVALAAALRETSVLAAVALARWGLGETVGPLHWAAAALALAGIAAIRLA